MAVRGRNARVSASPSDVGLSNLTLIDRFQVADIALCEERLREELSTCLEGLFEVPGHGLGAGRRGRHGGERKERDGSEPVCGVSKRGQNCTEELEMSCTRGGRCP